MQCSNKGCCQMQQPFLDPKTDKVHCSICEGEISQATHFAKQQMRMLKQFREKKKSSFSSKCHVCSLEERPVKKEMDWHCKGCGEKLNLTAPFKQILEMYSKNLDKEL